jgi:hypothetical protein
LARRLQHICWLKEDSIMALSIDAFAGQHSRTRPRESAGPSASDDFAALMDRQTAAHSGGGGRYTSDWRPHVDPLQGPTKPHVDPLGNLANAHVDPLDDRVKPHIDPLENLGKPHIDPLATLPKPHVDPLPNLGAPHVDPLEGLATAHGDPHPEVLRGDDRTQDRVVAAMHEAMTRFTSMSALLRLGQGI